MPSRGHFRWEHSPGFASLGKRAGGTNTTVKEKYITIYPKGDFNHNWEVDIGDVALVVYIVVNRAPAQVPDADFNAKGLSILGTQGKLRISW